MACNLLVCYLILGELHCSELTLLDTLELDDDCLL